MTPKEELALLRLVLDIQEHLGDKIETKFTDRDERKQRLEDIEVLENREEELTKLEWAGKLNV